MSAPIASEWLDLVSIQTLLRRHGYDLAATAMIISNAVVEGKVRVRIDGRVCPADRVGDLALDFARGVVSGWSPHGQVLRLNLIVDGDEGAESSSVSMQIEPDNGCPCEFNASDLLRHIRDLKEIEVPATRKNAGGRPGSWNWGQGMIYLGAHVLANGLPAEPVGLFPILRDWFCETAASGGPDDKQLRAWCRDAHATFKVALG